MATGLIVFSTRLFESSTRPSAMNRLMALANLIALVMLSGIVAKETREYWKNRKQS